LYYAFRGARISIDNLRRKGSPKTGLPPCFGYSSTNTDAIEASRISIDNLRRLPEGGLPFVFFKPPTIDKWQPLYGLFETETVVTIRCSVYLLS
jgi:hypothetical protein